MAKPKKYPEVMELEVGIDALLIPGSVEAVKRAVNGYAKRCSPPRKFSVVNSIVDGVVSVTRLPDPEPEAA